MANSFAFVISKNTYPDAFQANLIGVDQGTRIVYSATDTLTSQSVLYADSRLTQPIYGDGTSWYGVQLLTNTSVLYAITISESGVIAINSSTTTTTAAPTTTTTTAAPTTTTTTTAAVLNFIGRVGGSSNDACNGSNVTLYTTGPLIAGNYPQSGIIVYSDPALTQPVTSAYVASPGIGQVWECFNGELYNQQSCG
jgi:hypothetical protein